MIEFLCFGAITKKRRELSGCHEEWGFCYYIFGVTPPHTDRQTGRLRVTSCPSRRSDTIGGLLFLGERDRIGECVLMFADRLAGATIIVGGTVPVGKRRDKRQGVEEGERVCVCVQPTHNDDLLLF